MNSQNKFEIHNFRTEVTKLPVRNIENHEILIDIERTKELQRCVLAQFQKILREEVVNEQVKIVVDYDNTIILQSGNGECETIFRTKDMLQELQKIFNGKTTLEEVKSKLKDQQPLLRQLCKKELSPEQKELVIQTQYSILNFFNGLADFLLANKIKNIELVSNSSFYLLFFGVYFTAQASQIISPAEDGEIIPNPIQFIFESGILSIMSCCSVNATYQKVKTFMNIAKMEKVKFIISIGDGDDEQNSAQNVFLNGINRTVALKFQYGLEESNNFNALIAFHQALFELLNKQNYSEFF